MPTFYDEDQIDALIAIARYALKKSKPQVIVSYIYSPGHTPSGVTYDSKNKQPLVEYKDFYDNESKIAALHLNRLISFIQDEDPTAILYVFGDHGPWTSRGIDVEKDSKFVIQDRYGVYGGIFPKDRCKKSFSLDGLNQQKFMTVSKAAHWIIRCLSDGENAMLSIKDYKLPDMPSGVSNRFEDYLYE